MSELATVEYTVTKMIKASDDATWYKIGDRKILMSCKATLKAGIDFRAIGPDQVTIEGRAITIELPKAKLLSVNIRPEDIKVEYEEVGILRSEFSAAEKNALMVQGEQQIRSLSAETGILQDAESNASVFVTNFFRQLGYDKVEVRFGTGAAKPNRQG